LFEKLIAKIGYFLKSAYIKGRNTLSLVIDQGEHNSIEKTLADLHLKN
jgi:hypothetical protein